MNSKKLSTASPAATVLLINPNTSRDTTRMMQSIAQASLPDCEVQASTAITGVPMIATRAELAQAAHATLACWQTDGGDCDGVILACFGDPALDALRDAAGVPVVGLCEAAMQAAAQDGRRFGIVTTTPDLALPITAQAERLGLAARYTGLRATPGDPHALLRAGPAALETALLAAIADAVAKDGAEVVILGGGPLGHMAQPLASRSPVPLIAPLAAAAQALRAQLAALPAHARPLTHFPT